SREPRAASREPRAALLAVRSAGALHRLLDVLPVFEGDERISTRITLVPGSAFDLDALALLDRAGARTISWEEACHTRHDLILCSSPKGAQYALTGPQVVLPHGAGFNKSVGAEGSPHLPSGLDPHFLLVDSEPWADLYALAHREQVARLAEYCPPAASRATVVGDPTLDRLLESVAHRDTYREALGTGERRLIVLTSTWGPESLLARRPELPRELIDQLPHDEYQLGLVMHPNEHSRMGGFDLTRRLAPAVSAGLVVAEPYTGWASLLVAADAVITDHGSTALYAAALGRPVISAYDGGSELLPRTPMARMLAAIPQLGRAADLDQALRAVETLSTERFANAAFELRGQALSQLRTELYRLLDLSPPNAPITPHPLPQPNPVPHQLSAFAVRTRVDEARITVSRFPPGTRERVQHLAAEHPTAGQRRIQSASVLWRRARPAPAEPHASRWTASGWTAHVLAEAPGCRTAAALLSPHRCLIHSRAAGLFSVRVEPCRVGGRVVRTDVSAVVSAVHAWMAGTADWTTPTSLICEIGSLAIRVRLLPADSADLDYEL
ncbi:translation initiation factor 2, partial [Streptomyces cucumeris]|uniref:translation initiation factor 2 n=1 Tax=Streptomyces cucumeris TaxID=2962890 RepID=UPI003D7359F6